MGTVLDLCATSSHVYGSHQHRCSAHLTTGHVMMHWQRRARQLGPIAMVINHTGPSLRWSSAPLPWQQLKFSIGCYKQFACKNMLVLHLQVLWVPGPWQVQMADAVCVGLGRFVHIFKHSFVCFSHAALSPLPDMLTGGLTVNKRLPLVTVSRHFSIWTEQLLRRLYQQTLPSASSCGHKRYCWKAFDLTEQRGVTYVTCPT